MADHKLVQNITPEINVVSNSGGCLRYVDDAGRASTRRESAQQATILGDATSSGITISLPTAASSTGRLYAIKKIDSSANTVTIDANSSETIDGAVTKTLSAQWETVTLQCDGSAWFVV